MERKKQLYISTADPFTLLKVCQLLREISCGEALKLVIEGGSVPEELFKIIPPERFEIMTKRPDAEPEHIQIVIRKKEIPLPDASQPSDGGGCCS